MIARLQRVFIEGTRLGFIAILVPITYLPLACDKPELDTPAGLGGP
jgi:hypothetical protein